MWHAHAQTDNVLAAPVKEPWVPNEEEAGMVEAMLAREDAWDASRAAKPSWNVGKDAGKTGAPWV